MSFTNKLKYMYYLPRLFLYTTTMMLLIINKRKIASLPPALVSFQQYPHIILFVDFFNSVERDVVITPDVNIAIL